MAKLKMTLRFRVMSIFKLKNGHENQMIVLMSKDDKPKGSGERSTLNLIKTKSEKRS